MRFEIPFNENFFAPMICEPVDFYSYVSKIKRKRFVNREFLNRKNTGINDVVAYMIKNNINYFILPYLINAESPYDIIIVPNHTEIKWIEKKEFQMLLNFPNNDFSLVNKWEFEKFGLALFKINKSNFL